jgi:hypothetical protein
MKVGSRRMIVAAMGAAAAYVLGVAPARGQAGPGEKPPWTSQLKRFCLLPKNGIKTIDGWTGLMEDLCAPADEVESFNKRVRDPAGGVLH